MRFDAEALVVALRDALQADKEYEDVRWSDVSFGTKNDRYEERERAIERVQKLLDEPMVGPSL